MRRAPLLLTLLGVVLVTVGWWLFLISPRNAKISDIDQERVAAADTESRLRGQLAQLQAIRDNELEYLAALGRLDDLIPERPLLEEFIDEVDDLAIETGVSLQTLSPSLPSPLQESDLREIQASVQIEGEFFELVGFLFGLHDMERLVRVDGISVSSSQTDEGTVLSATLELRLFTLADVIPLAVVEEPADGEGGTTTTTTTVPGATSTTAGDVEATPSSEVAP